MNSFVWTDVENYSHFTNKNSQLVASYIYDTSGFYRNDRHQTTFIEVPKQDILNIWNDIPNEKGFKDDDVISGLAENYMNGAVNGSGGRVGGLPSGIPDQRKYFYRGFDTADCIEFLIRLGIV